MELEDLYKPIEDDLEKVALSLRKALGGEDEIVDQLFQYVLATSGKRLRPALVLFSAKMGEGRGETRFTLAAAVELIHTAALIHDDLIDEAEYRRNQKSINSRWGMEISICLGDYLYTKGFSLLAKLEATSSIGLLSDVTNTMCDGEIREVVDRFNPDMKEEKYLQIIEKKTASLLSACCQVGATAGKMKEEEINALADYGLNVGMAFQITDDCLDLIGSEETMGKPRGRDLIGGKITLPLIYTFQRIPKAEKDRIQNVIQERTLSDDDLPWILERMKETDGLGDALESAKSFVKTSKESLKIIPDSETKETLLKLADFTVERSA
jgi:octaprenyl-diphosphate synthase